MVDIEQVKKDAKTATTNVNALIKEIVKEFEEKHKGVTLKVSAIEYMTDELHPLMIQLDFNPIIL